MFPHIRSCIALFSGAFFCASAFGNGSRLPSQDAWAVARGYAATAGISSSAAVYYNPAGLAEITSAEIRTGFHFIEPEISFTSAATGRTVDEQSDTFFQPHFFAAVPLRENLVLGAGVYSPFGQSTDWPVTSGFGGIATFNEVKYITGAVALSWRFGPNLSLGIGLQYSRAEIDLNRLAGVAPGVVSAFSFRGKDSAPSGNIGVKWQPMPGHKFGLHYQRKTDFTFDGTAALAGILSQPGRVGWVFPDNLAAGWQWNFLKGWEGEISVDWTNWNRVNTLHLNAGPLSTAVPLNWETSAYYGIGITRQFTPALAVSIGYNYSENSIPDSSFTPALPDVDRHLLNAGVFWTDRNWQVGFLLQRGLRGERTLRGPAPDGLGGSAAGRYENALWAGELSLAYKF